MEEENNQSKDEANYDAQNMKSILDDFPMQCKKALELGRKTTILHEIDTIFICGMGGSGIAGDVLKAYLMNLPTHVYVIKDYDLPFCVTKKSLVFVLSYSGNTEETISCFRHANRIGSVVITISSGGKLELLCEKYRTSHLKIPAGLPPRTALGYLLFPMLTILQNSKVIPNLSSEINKTIEALEKNVFEDIGKNIAEKLVGKIPLIYSSSRLMPVAQKWKTDINENAKVHAFYNTYPECNHNEINGFVNHNGKFFVIMLKDDEDNMRIRKRIRITKELIKKNGVDVLEMEIKGDNYLSKLISSIYLGSWISYHLALKLKTDPSDIWVITELKEKMGAFW